MYNFSIDFIYPWLLLLLIPAVALTLIPYFRLSKRYRKTRNRITSIVLHLIVMTLSISVLAGMTFQYDVPNKENELIVLVDVSDTEEQSAAARDEFVYSVVRDAGYDGFRLGIVTFGFDQEYVVPFTYDMDGVYETYLNATTKPDTSATNIAAALTYAKDLFDHPKTAKIVLVTDGKQTDEEANNVIRSVAAMGIKVDIAYVSSEFLDADARIVTVEQPDYHMLLNEEFSLSLTVDSKVATTATLELTDNGKASPVTPIVENISLKEGLQTIVVNHKFAEDGLHDLTFKLSAGDDELEANDTYHTYLYMELFNNILVLETQDGQSKALEEMLNAEDDEAFKVTTCNLLTSDNIPQSVEELRAYDQIILNNVANADLTYDETTLEGNPNEYLPAGFDLMLQEYVSVYGGGLFTLGGSNADDDEAHAYDRTDMYGSTYQKMLPVEAVDYTPPVGVVVIIDRSGSMEQSDIYGQTNLAWARSGASACFYALTERDYLGVMTLDDVQDTILPLTACTRANETRILSAIDSVSSTEGTTVFPGAVERAGQALIALQEVDKRHIILVTDGMVPNEQVKSYEEMIDKYHTFNNITVSVIGVGVEPGSDAYNKMKHAADLGGGRIYGCKSSDLVTIMSEDLKVEEIKSVNLKEFSPTVNNETSPLVQGLKRGEEQDKNKLTVKLDGFYGVKKKEAAEVVLVGDFGVPIYAQWRYGNGMVGSFMCDLYGKYSSKFITDTDGQKFIRNVVNNLMPMENIRPTDITLELIEDNYTNQLNVYTTLESGQTLVAEIVRLENNETVATWSMNTVTAGDKAALRNSACYVTVPLAANNKFTRCNFVVRKGGTYKIVVSKADADGNILVDEAGKPLSSVEIYKSFAYSEEYDTSVPTEEELLQLNTSIENLAKRGEGVVIEDLDDPWEVFYGFETSLHRVFDPRILFMILAIVLFLTDIAVRKFKFKWPHEIIRERKNKKNSK